MIQSCAEHTYPIPYPREGTNRVIVSWQCAVGQCVLPYAHAWDGQAAEERERAAELSCVEAGDKKMEAEQAVTHNPGQSQPVFARRLARIFRSHSMSVSGDTNVNARSGLEFPIVVSCTTSPADVT